MDRRDEDDAANEERPAKRVKVVEVAEGDEHLEPVELESMLPPSSLLFRAARRDSSRTAEEDVGITEYVSSDVPPLYGIIKQRFTDFLVFEVDRSGNVVHLKDITKPVEEKPPPPARSTRPEPEASTLDLTIDHLWHPEFDEALEPFLSQSLRQSLRHMYEEGRDPPPASDAGWAQRGKRPEVPADSTAPQSPLPEPEIQPDLSSKKSGRNKGKWKANKAEQGRVNARSESKDSRRVVSEPIETKESRTRFHEVIRTVFRGKLETETLQNDIDGSATNKISIRWSHGKKKDTPRKHKPDGPKPHAFAHFTMHKTNRDTHDALSHLSRMTKLPVRDFGVAGTKDKRGVTTQRVSVKLSGRNLETLWRLANNVPARRSAEEAVSERGERGIRLGDLVYASESLELGDLNGNAFVITLRNVKVVSDDHLNRAMESVKSKGYINYYGMQRFGTAAVPTHAVGLALLKSDWQRAVYLILCPRPGEHPDVDAGRRAWLEERDLDKALRLLPRRVVAERCILENFKKQGGESRNSMGALSTIPRNLRTMYTHAYQSYVWNTIVSERIRRFGATAAVAGDLVYEHLPSNNGMADVGPEVDMGGANLDAEVEGTFEEQADGPSSRKAWVPPAVKVLTAEDAEHYSIFDVILPLPGKDVVYPGGELGDLYAKILAADGVDITRQNRQYSLLGSYRKIIQVPQDVSWTALRYTDPDGALAQADEDKLLGFDELPDATEGKFLALQIRLTLPTAAYATMVLREITKADTGTHHQTALTKASEDQEFRRQGEVITGGAREDMDV